MTVKVKYYYFLDGTFEGKIWKDEKERYHREDGPAYESYEGIRKWFKNGKLHREDGPAIICNDGNFRYFVNNKKYSKKEYWKEIEKLRE